MFSNSRGEAYNITDVVPVSILVIMECSRIAVSWYGSRIEAKVSILVIMECSRIVYLDQASFFSCQVSILVIMECSRIVLRNKICVKIQRSFNPCYNGMFSNRKVGRNRC